MKKIKYKSLMIDSETKERIEAMAKAQNKKMSVLIKEVFDLLFDQSNEFNPCIMVSDGHSGKVVFGFSGHSALVFVIGKSDKDVKEQAEGQFNRKRDLENE